MRLEVVVVVSEPEIRREFDAVYASQFAPMVRLAYVTTGSRAAAEDVVQEAFVELLRRPDVREPAAWLRRAVVSRCTSWVRTRSHRRSAARRWSPRRLATVRQGDGDQFVDRLQLAIALLPDAQIRDADVDRGPWP